MLENIFLTKAELYDYIKIYSKQIFVNADDQNYLLRQRIILITHIACKMEMLSAK